MSSEVVPPNPLSLLWSSQAQVVPVRQKQPRDLSAYVVDFDKYELQGPPLTLVRRLLGEGGTSIWYGKWRAAKSFLLLDLAFSVATGRQWMGRAVKKGPVLYCAGEGANALRVRFEALRKTYSYLKNNVPLRLLTIPVDIQKDADAILLQLMVMERIFGEPPVLVVFDTLVRYLGGSSNDSSAEDATKFVNALSTFQAKYPALHNAAITHFGKEESKGIRGSSVFPAAADTIVKVSIVGERKFSAWIEKQKDGPDDCLLANYSLAVVKVGVDREFNEEITSCVIEYDKTNQKFDELDLSQRTIVMMKVLRDWARDEPNIIKSEIDRNSAYRSFEMHICNSDTKHDTVLRRAQATLEQLNGVGLVAWKKGDLTIKLLPRFWMHCDRYGD